MRFYLLDVYVPALRLCFELDGKFHSKQIAYDMNRSDDLINDWQIVTIRFANKEIETLDFDKIIRLIIKEQVGKKIEKLDKDLSNWNMLQ